MTNIDYRHGNSQTFRDLASQRALEDAKRPIPPLHHVGRFLGALAGELKAIGQEVTVDIRSHWKVTCREMKRVSCAVRFGLMATTYAYYRMEVA